MVWRATVLTLFPEMFPGPLGISLAGRALASGVWALVPIFTAAGTQLILEQMASFVIWHRPRKATGIGSPSRVGNPLYRPLYDV